MFSFVYLVHMGSFFFRVSFVTSLLNSEPSLSDLKWLGTFTVLPGLAPGAGVSISSQAPSAALQSGPRALLLPPAGWPGQAPRIRGWGCPRESYPLLATATRTHPV